MSSGNKSEHRLIITSKEDGSSWSPNNNNNNNIEHHPAFLNNSNLWEKALSNCDADFKLHGHSHLEYVDLDEFFVGDLPLDAIDGRTHHLQPHIQQHLAHHALLPPHQNTSSTIPGQMPPNGVKICPPSPPASPQCTTSSSGSHSPDDSSMISIRNNNNNLPPLRGYDTRGITKTYSDDDIKMQPIKKSKKQVSKQFVPEDLKDDKYWARRRKNNMAAKRSRDARRMKENQIALRASFLEKETNTLKQELDRLQKENIALREKVSKLEAL